MSTRKATLAILIATTTVVLLGIFPLEAQQAGREAKDTSARIAAALEEMRTISQQLVAFRNEAYQAGTIGFQEVMTAQRQLLELELRLANSSADRNKVLSQQLELAGNTEEVASARYESGQATLGDVLQAKLARMHIEVRILEEPNE